MIVFVLHAERFAEHLQSKGFRVLNDVVFNQVLVACDTPEHTKATLGTHPKVRGMLVRWSCLEWRAGDSNQCMFLGNDIG